METNNLEQEHKVSWLNTDLFNNVVKQIVPDLKKIISFKCSRALKPGENYATLMLRVHIDAQLIDDTIKPISLMMKLPIEIEGFMDMFLLMFECELDMYVNVVAELEEMYRKTGRNIKFSANCYRLNTDKVNILFEDLRQRGFKNADRHEGLDLQHTKSVLEKIAQWHAASAVRVQNKGPYGDAFTKAYFREAAKESFINRSEELSDIIMPCLEQVSGSKHFMRAVRNFHPKSAENICAGILQDSDEFLVLNHGDLWTNNIMFQYDDAGNIQETYLVDYQVPVYSSPTHDLLHFLLSSTKYELKISQFDYFIYYYHECLTKYLSILKYNAKIPTLKDLHISCLRRGAWAYHCCVTVCGAVLMDSTEEANLVNFLSQSGGGASFKHAMFTAERYQKHAAILFPWLLNRGAFEQ